MRRLLVKSLLALAAAIVAALLAGTWVVRAAARGRTYSDARLIPHRTVGLVLGCGVPQPGGAPNPFFDRRVAAAAALYRAGRVDALLTSGESLPDGYDEAAALKASLVAAGVPAARIYCDRAGFRTLDSMVRARRVFGQTALTVISQEDHNRRAIFLARHYGLDAIGYNAAAVGVIEGFGNWVREPLARVDALLDVFLWHTQPREMGPRVKIVVRGPSGRGRS